MKQIKAAFYLHRWLFLFSCVYMATVGLTAAALGATFREFLDVIGYFTSACLFMLFYPMLILIAWLIRALIHARQRNPLAWARKAMDEFDAQAVSFFSDGPFWEGVAAIVTILPLNIFFCVGKSLIPHLASYSWDPDFAALDKLLAFGRYPHEIITPLIDRLNIGTGIDSLYIIWFLVLFLAQGYCIFADRDETERMRYLWATLLCWAVIGTGFALLFASVGPAFYADYYPGPSPYAGLIPHLKQISPDLEVLRLGPDMLALRGNGKVVNLNALSAMPSLHVGIAALNACYFWRKSRLAGAAMAGYGFIIFIGSIYLGWHYAIDGYAGAAFAILAWIVSGRIVARLHPDLQADE
jgi:membrane-associated phospholipid phosphatase